MESHIVDIITHFKTALGNASLDTSNDVVFHYCIKFAYEWYPLTEKDIAHRFGVSISTVKRWLSGENAPHPAARNAVYKWLIEQADVAIEQHQKEGQ